MLRSWHEKNRGGTLLPGQVSPYYRVSLKVLSTLTRTSRTSIAIDTPTFLPLAVLATATRDHHVVISSRRTLSISVVLRGAFGLGVRKGGMFERGETDNLIALSTSIRGLHIPNALL